MGRHCPGLSAAGALALGIGPDGRFCDPAFGREVVGHGGGDLVVQVLEDADQAQIVNLAVLAFDV